MKKNTTIEKLINNCDNLSCKFKLIDGVYEYTIKDIHDYISTIKTLQDESLKCNNTEKLFFRGMEEPPGESWGITPSIHFNNMVKYENELVKSFINKRPLEFSNMEDNFEMIAKMQHFGLPTRVLDFSLNPFISLYFATTKNEQNAGKVVVHLNKLDVLDSESIKKITFSFFNITAKDYNYCSEIIDKNHIEYKMDNDYVFLDKLLDFKKKDLVRYLFNYYFHYNCIPMCTPRYYSEREKNQQAVFMLFTNDIYDFEQKEILNTSNIYSILGTNIDADSVDNLEKRFIPKPQLKVLDNTQLQENFLYIRIPKKIKADIQNFLNTLGICNSFVYPELNFVSQDIKNDVQRIIANE